MINSHLLQLVWTTCRPGSSVWEPFSKPLAHLFNKSTATSTVPLHWKDASIRPVRNTVSPQVHSNNRPISITPVICRTLQRFIVKEFLYPAILAPPTTLSFRDQYAFRSTGSITVAPVRGGGVHTFDIAPLRSESPPQKRSGMTRVLKGFHSFTRNERRMNVWVCR